MAAMAICEFETECVDCRTHRTHLLIRVALVYCIVFNTDGHGLVQPLFPIPIPSHKGHSWRRFFAVGLRQALSALVIIGVSSVSSFCLCLSLSSTSQVVMF